MYRPIFGHSFVVLVAPILLLVLVFKLLNKKKTNAHRNNYEVFLSFRGSDTRYSFTDHLYKQLCDAGIHTFRDNEELRQGEEISPDLLAAIKNSKILIPILSVNYGESKWCLEELVQIMECKKNKTGQIVLPVFYKVAPADVRYQKGSFGEAFNKRESSERARRSDSTILEKWKQALKEVSDLKGQEANGSEVELINSVVQQVLLELKKKFELVTPENLVGIDSHVKKVMKSVDNNSRAALFVGIHGMGGIGKTTLAKAIYNKLSDKFEHHSFIADIRESCKRNGFEFLQNQLISDTLKKDHKVSNKDEGIRFISSNMKGKKVLILLDDVDKDDQWKALAGNHNWFSSESIIIITSRNKNILENANVDCIYELNEMDEETSLILFSRHAFQRDAPPKEFEVLTHSFVSATGGLPQCIEILGSFLRNKERGVWEGTIKKLGNFPPVEVQKRLRISYDALEYEQQQIFLDIACFFIGTDLRIASYMWDACGFFPKVVIEVLSSMSLIKVEENHKLRMHNQLRDLGRHIVRLEAKNKLRIHSRLWDSEEALQLLKEDEGTRKVEAIRLGKYSSSFPPSACETTNQDGYVFTGEQFKELRNLRFLEATGAHFSGDFNNSFRKLKWLRWQHCPSTFEANNFRAEELVVLDLAESEISDKWQGWSSIMMAKELKYIDLSYCTSLEKTSFLSAFEKLEVLILRDCSNIEQIDSSIGKMKSLVRLDLSGCLTLKGLPVEVGKLEALEQISLRSSGIRQLPDSIGDLQNLETLDVGGTEIEELPSVIGRLRKLRELKASHCIKLREMPESIRNLSSLQRLDLEHCKKLLALPVEVGKLEALEHLLLNRSGIRQLPNSIVDLQNLETLDVGGTEIEELPSDVGRLRKLRELKASHCIKLREMPESIRNLSSLQRLELDACEKLQSLSVLPYSLKSLRVTCQSHRLPTLPGCEFLEFIREPPSIPSEISLNTPFELEILELDRCNLLEILDVSQFNYLRNLSVRRCDNIHEIRGLDKLDYLESLVILKGSNFENPSV